MRFRPLAILIPLVLLVLPALHAQREKFSMDDVDFIEKTWPTAKKTNTGIRYLIQKEGEGAPPKPGDMVSVHYDGKLFDGTRFDSNQDNEHPFKFRVARQQVIAGWDQVLQLMKPGEIRFVVIPPELAYGSRSQGKIPKDSSLTFTIELLKVDRVEP